MVMDHFSTLIPPFADPIRHNMNDNFVMYLGEDTAKAGVYPNLDAAYLLAVGYDVGLPAGTHYIARVTATLPLTARNLVAAPKVASKLDYDVRYASFSTLGLVQGGPTADTLDDASFHRFYGEREGWTGDRKVSFVVAPSTDHTCGIYNATEDLFLTTQIRGVPQDYWGALVWCSCWWCCCFLLWEAGWLAGLESNTYTAGAWVGVRVRPALASHFIPSHPIPLTPPTPHPPPPRCQPPGILYRQLIPKYLHTGLPDRTNGYAHVACSNMPDNDACVDPVVLEEIQGDYYPHITFYKCSENGVLEEVTKKLHKIPIGGK